MKALRHVIPAIVVLSTFVPPVALAQSTAASISGTVKDEQNAVISGAAITLKNVDTGQTRKIVTDPTGNRWYLATRIETVSPDELQRRAAEYAKKRQEGS